MLTEQQTKSILEEQKKIWVKFGLVAVLQGVIGQQTVDFFLDNLFPLEALDSPLIGKRYSVATNNVAVESANYVEPLEESQSEQIDYDDIPWID